jgi:hypothetical protein
MMRFKPPIYICGIVECWAMEVVGNTNSGQN